MEQNAANYYLATQMFLVKFEELWSVAVNSINIDGEQLKGGNRLRPQICLWGYLLTINPSRVQEHDYTMIANVAVSIELVHKALLLIDDWIDNDSERHGKRAFHIEYSPQQAVLSALNMIGYAMDRLDGVFANHITPSHNYYLCLNTLVKTVHSMAEGALAELRLENLDFFNRGKIEEIMQLETAEILGNSMLLGYYAGVGANVSKHIEKKLKEFGDKCGYLFQAFNDMEAFANPQKLVTHKGGWNLDYQSRRKNIAVVTLFELANERDRKAILESNESSLLRLMEKYQVLNTLKRELDNLYGNLIESCFADFSNDIPDYWAHGLRNFLIYIKEFAEERL